MKRDYQKPMIEVVELVTEEIMVGGGMDTGSNTFDGPNI